MDYDIYAKLMVNNKPIKLHVGYDGMKQATLFWLEIVSQYIPLNPFRDSELGEWSEIRQKLQLDENNSVELSFKLISELINLYDFSYSFYHNQEQQKGFARMMERHWKEKAERLEKLEQVEPTHEGWKEIKSNPLEGKLFTRLDSDQREPKPTIVENYFEKRYIFDPPADVKLGQVLQHVGDKYRVIDTNGNIVAEGRII